MLKKIFGLGEDDIAKDLDSEVDNFQDDSEIGQIAVDILETDYEIIITAPIAGIELDDLDISFDKSVLTISGQREIPEIYSRDDIIVRNSECYWGKFVRNIILPENLDFEDISATMENNLLLIVVKKLQFSSKHIKVNRIGEEF